MLSLNTNGEMWRLRCYWVFRGDRKYDTYYLKVLRYWVVEDPRDTTISEVRASMRNVMDRIREVLFKDLYAAVDTYDKIFEVRPELEDTSILLGSDHSFTDKT